MEAGAPMIRRQFLCAGIALMISIISPLYSQSGTPWKDPSPHAVRFVSVGDGVRLEVLDWDGSGRAVVLLAGGGDTAHVFDDFAPKLTTHNHVYGITRRGFGASGYADAENVGERLGEDVLAVIDALKLDKPILVGHSIAGDELSWMANRYPDRVSGVVYLEAGYSYGFDDGKGASALDMMKLQAPQPPPPSAADLVSFKAYFETMRCVAYIAGRSFLRHYRVHVIRVGTGVRGRSRATTLLETKRKTANSLGFRRFSLNPGIATISMQVYTTHQCRRELGASAFLK
jgi:pimeloyl-ACP methyl ester carboxylesterase